MSSQIINTVKTGHNHPSNGFQNRKPERVLFSVYGEEQVFIYIWNIGVQSPI